MALELSARDCSSLFLPVSGALSLTNPSIDCGLVMNGQVL